MNGLRYLQAGAAFGLAGIWSALAMPAALEVGIRLGLVKQPRLFRSRLGHTVSYLGGITLAVVATASLLLAGGLSREATTLLGGGVVLLSVGFMDDRSTNGGIAWQVRLGLEAAVAVAAWSGGLRLEVLGVGWFDAALSIFFLVAVINAFNLLDNMDGVAGATAAVTAAGIFVLAALSGQYAVAILAAAVSGSALGFLRLNLVRARVYLGNGGSLFLGFVLGATALKLRLPLHGLGGFLIILAGFAVPATDTSVAVLSRFLAGRPIVKGGVDHVSHRLVRLGLSPRGAALAHAAGAVLGSGAAIMAVSTRDPVPAALAVGLFAVAGLGLLRVRVTGPRARRLPRLAPALGAVAVVVVVPSAIAGVLAQRDLVHARAALLNARRALGAVQPAAANAALSDADRDLTSALARLTSVAALPGRLVPGLRGNLEVTIALARSGKEMVAAGRQSAAVLDALAVHDGHMASPWQGGTLDLSVFQRASGLAAEVPRRVDAAEQLVRSSHGILLLPQVRRARQETLAALAQGSRDAHSAAAVLSLLPQALGVETSRVWLVGAENTAELRGRGGYLGAFGVVTADRGKLTLGSFLPTSNLPSLSTAFVGADVPVEYQSHYRGLGGLDAWPNLNMSPNFPSAGRLLLSRLAASGGPTAGGVVVLDPTALAYLIGATGPIQVAGLPELLTAGNVVEWSLNRIYVFDAADNKQRKATLADVAQAAWRRVLSGGVDPLRLAQAVGRAARENHLLVYSTDPVEQAAFAAVGITGAVQETLGDYLMVLTQNLGENKMDYYLQRDVAYRGQVDTDGSVEAQVEVTVHNTAPTSAALTEEVGGARPHLKLAPGMNRSYLSVYAPAQASLEGVSIDGEPTTNFDDALELGKRFFATTVEVGPGESKSVSFSYRIPHVLVGDRYRLTVQNQTTVRPDRLSIRVKGPKGASVATAQGFGSGELSWAGSLISDAHFGADLVVPLPARLAHDVVASLERLSLRIGH
jgi:UDP-N-acetylmuramyl pentapeptide phosphotransferase/UDP-N-acetylglucosamine-1-phosphate transferase